MRARGRERRLRVPILSGAASQRGSGAWYPRPRAGVPAPGGAPIGPRARNRDGRRAVPVGAMSVLVLSVRLFPGISWNGIGHFCPPLGRPLQGAGGVRSLAGRWGSGGSDGGGAGFRTGPAVLRAGPVGAPGGFRARGRGGPRRVRGAVFRPGRDYFLTLEQIFSRPGQVCPERYRGGGPRGYDHAAATATAGGDPPCRRLAPPAPPPRSGRKAPVTAPVPSRRRVSSRARPPPRVSARRLSRSSSPFRRSSPSRRPPVVRRPPPAGRLSLVRAGDRGRVPARLTVVRGPRPSSPPGRRPILTRTRPSAYPYDHHGRPGRPAPPHSRARSLRVIRPAPSTPPPPPPHPHPRPGCDGLRHTPSALEPM